ncbi:hypothetical protein MRX96_022187 [Rhipicephalus microplus]
MCFMPMCRSGYFTNQEKQEPEAEPEEEPTDLPAALATLEAQRQRCRELMHLNVVLRRNLEITTRTNEELTSEVHELTEEWRQADRSRNGNRPQGRCGKGHGIC